ncbi:LysR family transcriptional regulator [Nioella nitratireducens]|uniref:LysR family transcriptional regulator n=1 Tax=Nioella nitratireducens TaxID=1287720 RepID=UPI0008FCF178|nr:LysR family transcriptional regulator [Nioella nitratireducens]
MMSRNLRHFRVFLAVADLHSPTQAAVACGVSQPAVTQSLGKLENEAGGPLFERTRQGFFLTERGALFEARLRRAMTRLDTSLSEVSPRLILTATAAQLTALIAMTEAQNFTLAARRLGLAQPTVHRAIAQIEQEAPRPMFERTSFGMVPTRPCQRLAQAARLAFSEFDQAAAELAEFDGREVGRIVVGALPLSRSVLLPAALARFHAARPRQRVTVLDGRYDDLLGGIRRGDVDVMIGALRDPLPIADVTQESLFDDHLAFVAGPEHPLAGARDVPLDGLTAYSWVVPRSGTPSRSQFDALFVERGLPMPDRLLECGSILMMRELLRRGAGLGCISGKQAEAEIANGLLVRVKAGIEWPGRPIGLTYRAEWVPTKAQAQLLDLIRDEARA